MLSTTAVICTLSANSRVNEAIPRAFQLDIGATWKLAQPTDLLIVLDKCRALTEFIWSDQAEIRAYVL